MFSQMNPMKGEKNKEIEGGIEARLGGKWRHGAGGGQWKGSVGPGGHKDCLFELRY